MIEVWVKSNFKTCTIKKYTYRVDIVQIRYVYFFCVIVASRGSSSLYSQKGPLL